MKMCQIVVIANITSEYQNFPMVRYFWDTLYNTKKKNIKVSVMYCKSPVSSLNFNYNYVHNIIINSLVLFVAVDAGGGEPVHALLEVGEADEK